jgi:hypothetical protein
MKIYSESPKDWKDLQNKVAKYLCELGYGTEIEKDIQTVREIINIDVYARIIISKAGFQSGSYEAVKNTNILLLDWKEFQDYFKIKWIKSKQFLVSKETKPLYDYVSAGPIFFKEQYNKLSETELKTFEHLYWEYFHIAFNSSNLNYLNFTTNEFDIKMFEMFFISAKKDFGRNFTSYEEYYNFLIEKSKEGIRKFDNLFKERLRRKNQS